VVHGKRNFVYRPAYTTDVRPGESRPILSVDFGRRPGQTPQPGM